VASNILENKGALNSFPAAARYFFFSKASSSTLELSQSPNPWVSGVLSLRVKWQVMTLTNHMNLVPGFTFSVPLFKWLVLN